MKKIRLYIAYFLAAFALVAALALLLPGCGTAPQRAYQTASGTQITVTAAMTAWGNYVAQFHPPADQEKTVKDAYDKYHASALLVADAGAALVAGTGSQSALDAAISAAAGSLGDLVNLLQQFGVVLPAAK